MRLFLMFVSEKFVSVKIDKQLYEIRFFPQGFIIIIFFVHRLCDTQDCFENRATPHTRKG